MDMRMRWKRAAVVGAVFTIALFWTGCQDTDRMTGPEELPLGLGPNLLVVAASDNTYTLDADFEGGTLLNVNHDPNHDQLQLNQVAVPFPFVNIAVSNRGTVARIDVNTGAVLGEYSTNPDGGGVSTFPNPSRTTVDQLGNVWVANRNDHFGSPLKGSVARIGLVIGGTRVNSDGTGNPVGDYLAPSFQYNTCLDRDNDGLIKTSRGLTDIRP